VLAIPAKRHERAVICYLTPAETDALLAAPARTSWIGRRDHALLVLAVQTGLRVSELTSFRAERAVSPVDGSELWVAKQKYVHHCHIVEHEDNDMMERVEVGP
jgi:site-specific recombinase XerD